MIQTTPARSATIHRLVPRERQAEASIPRGKHGDVVRLVPPRPAARMVDHVGTSYHDAYIRAEREAPDA